MRGAPPRSAPWWTVDLIQSADALPRSIFLRPIHFVIVRDKGGVSIGLFGFAHAHAYARS